MTITQKLGQRKDHPESLIRASHLPISALGSLFAMTIPQHGLPHLSRKATVSPVIPRTVHRPSWPKAGVHIMRYCHVCQALYESYVLSAFDTI